MDGMVGMPVELKEISWDRGISWGEVQDLLEDWKIRNKEHDNPKLTSNFRKTGYFVYVCSCGRDRFFNQLCVCA